MLDRLYVATLLLLAACQSAPPRPENEAQGPSKVPAEHAPQRHDDRPVIVAFGDSLTAGFGVAPGQSYPDYLQRKLDEKGYSYHVVNEGVSGDTSTAGLIRVDSVIADQPQIVIVSFGGNDGLRGLPVETMEENLRQIVTKLRQADAQVVLGGMRLPPNYGREYVGSFEQVFPRVAKDLNVPLIPFLLEGVAARPELLYDEIHPNEQGNQIVAKVVFETLEPLLKKEASAN